MKHITETIIIFLKGLLMGVADIIPGVSGGTMAFITGIYERLIKGIKDININFVFSLLKFIIKRDKEYLNKARTEFTSMDFNLFLPLGGGIVIAFLIGSMIIPHLLESYPAYTFALFFGLIAGSVKIVHKRIEGYTLGGFLIGIIAFVFGFMLVGIKELSSSHSLLFIFFSGMIAICAMLLPGISGSFLLLVLGQYRYILEAIHNFRSNLDIIASFIAGALIGLLAFSRVISYFLRKHHAKTMFFLIGLMLGALRLPFENVFFVNRIYPQLNFVWGLSSMIYVGLLIVFGLLIVLAIDSFTKD